LSSKVFIAKGYELVKEIRCSGCRSKFRFAVGKYCPNCLKSGHENVLTIVMTDGKILDWDGND